MFSSLQERLSKEIHESLNTKRKLEDEALAFFHRSQTKLILVACVKTTPQLLFSEKKKNTKQRRKVKIPTVAIVENMSFFICDGCEKKHEIFQTGSGVP